MSARDDDDGLGSGRMSLSEHLNELRRRLFLSVAALAVCFGIAWWFKESLTGAVTWPWRTAVAHVNSDSVEAAKAALAADPSLPRTTFFKSDDPANEELRDPLDDRLTTVAMGESFFFALNVSLYVAICGAAPFVLYQIWAFVAAGLYRHEKRAVLKYFPFSVLLFGTGVWFCYRWVIPVGMYFLATTLPSDQVRTQVTLDNYFSFLSTLCLAMGAVFQLPLVILFLARLGIVEPHTFGKYRGHFLIGALFVAAVVTPGPDWYSQVLMTIPMVALYEVGILLARFTVKREPRR